jgi:hypothetical protein
MTNPANQKEKLVIPEGYQPMGLGTKRLDVPQKDGFNRRWFRGDPTRISRAMQAGYRFVDSKEVILNNFDLGGDAKTDGNSDMGSRVSVIAGDDIGPDGQAGRLYLMEIPNELYEYGRKFTDEVNDSVAEALRGGKVGAGQNDETRVDSATRYRKGQMPDLFTPIKDRRKS